MSFHTGEAQRANPRGSHGSDGTAYTRSAS